MSESRESFKARIGVGSPSFAFRILGGAGTSRTQPVPSDVGPGMAGSTTEHWDGRRDAVATGMTVTPTELGRASLAAHRKTKETS